MLSKVVLQIFVMLCAFGSAFMVIHNVDDHFQQLNDRMDNVIILDEGQ